MSMSIKYNRRGGNVRHNVGCRTRNLDAIFVARRKCFTCSISYWKDNIKCDSASNAPKCSLNNDVSIVQKHVVKLSNTSTMGTMDSCPGASRA